MRKANMRVAKFILACLGAVVVTACGGGGGSGTETAVQPTVTTPVPPPPPPPPPPSDEVANQLSGSVGDGPVIGANIRVYDIQGKLLGEFRSDDTASYSGIVKTQGNRYPLRIEADGGTDIVTGTAPDFRMFSTVMRPAQRTIGNIGPHSTLISAAARRIALGPTDNALASARTTVLEHLNFGFDTRIVGDPLTSAIDGDNVAVIVKSSEGLGEMIRRTRDALLTTGVGSADEVVNALSADLVDGVVDGRGVDGASARIAAVSHLASAQVLVELLTNDLIVNGIPARESMDSAIRQVEPRSTQLTGDVATPVEMLRQTVVMLDAAFALTGDPAIEETAAVVRSLPADSLPSDVEGRLPAAAGAALQSAIDLGVVASPEELEVVNSAVRNAEDPQQAVAKFSFDAASAAVAEGSTVDITVRRDSSNGDAAVTWRTRAATATADEDFQGQPGSTIHFADGQSSQRVSIETLADEIAEGDEVFMLELAEPAGAELGAPTTVEVTLIDGETPPPPPSDAGVFSLSTDRTSVVEGQNVELTVRRNAADVAATVMWETVDGTATASADFDGVSGRILSFAAGETAKNIVVATSADGIPEDDESFRVGLVSATDGASLGSPTSTTVTLVDGDAPPPSDPGSFALSSGDVVVTEGETARLTVRRSVADVAASVGWETAAGTATSGEDFDSISGRTISFAVGETSKSIAVATVDDGVEEGDENFTIRLLNPSDGATLGAPATATVTLLDTGAPPPPPPDDGSGRVTAGLQVLYNFDEGGGRVVTDVSGSGAALDLEIADTGKVAWGQGTLTVTAPTRIVSTASTAGLNQAIEASNAITVEAWVIPSNRTQTGPARIVSLSASSTARNVTLGQGTAGGPGDRYDVRLRTTTTGNNGVSPSLTSPAGSLSTALTHVVYTRDASGNARIYVDGDLIKSGTIDGDLSNWASDYGLVLANEQSADRPWLGTFDLVAIYDRALDAAEVWQNYQADADAPGNRAPVAGDDSATIPPGTTAEIEVLSNDVDPEGRLDPSSVVIVTAPSQGTATVDAASGVIVYQHGGGSGQSDSFTYRVSDRDGGTSAAATVSITVTGTGGGGMATVSWTPPTDRVDGSPLDSLAGFEVHYGQDANRLDQTIVIDNPGLTAYVVEGLGQGTWHFGVKAVDAAGRRSALSTIRSKTIP